MDQSLDIVKLIEDNPLIRFGGDYQSKFIERIRRKFSKDDEQIFLASYFCYLNCDPKAFVIDLRKHWKWIGFSRFDHAKTLLVKEFITGKDYKTASAAAEAVQNGGQNRQDIFLTVNCFKKLCLKARTKKADQIHDYYIKLEEVMHQTLEDESEELKIKLLEKDTLIKRLTSKDKFLYIGQSPIMRSLTKVGITEDLPRRLREHRTSNPSFNYVFTLKTDNAKIIEDHVKLLLKKWKSRSPEWFKLEYDQVKKVVDYAISVCDVSGDFEKLSNFIDGNMIETPVVETPVVETPVVETPVVETPVEPAVNFCVDCEESINKRSTRCLSCAAKHSNPRKVQNRPSLEQLEKDLETLYYTQVGRKYGVSDNCIRKWIKGYKKALK